ncbi:type II toxin-antitoxin system RelE/ParE family toxin [Nocardiopsis sp. CNT-189]|uniref:type II toxin-antitoxin system RelE family toxin n=1 Tax=Nocardiopsis oceanisediminis TaxID=2816862 RepID=UPI003B351A1F
MKYAFVFEEAATKALKKIPQPDAIALLRALSTLGDDPYAPNPQVKPLKGHDSLYRIRSGSYRAVYRIENDRLVILVIAVGPRTNVYRRY